MDSCNFKFIQCDIKPNSIPIGDTAQNDVFYVVDFNATHQYSHWTAQNDVLYVIDFNAVHQYQDPCMHIHIPSHNGLPFIGTPVFTSVDNHLE